MKVKVLNASSKKTRNELRKAFSELIQEKKVIKKITIQELVNKAGITRATFYTHYDNIYEIAEEIQDEVLDIIFEDLNDLKSLESLKQHSNKVTNFLKDNDEMYKKLLSSDETLIFINRLNKLMTKKLNEYILKNNIENKQLDINFYVDGLTSLSIKYFRNEINTTLDELNEYTLTMFEKIFK